MLRRKGQMCRGVFSHTASFHGESKMNLKFWKVFPYHANIELSRIPFTHHRDMQCCGKTQYKYSEQVFKIYTVKI